MRPGSVRLSVRLLRLRRRTPNRRSTFITCLLTIAVDRSSRSAAATKLPDSTTCRNTLMPVKVSMLRVYAAFGPSRSRRRSDGRPQLALHLRAGEHAADECAALFHILDDEEVRVAPALEALNHIAYR